MTGNAGLPVLDAGDGTPASVTDVVAPYDSSVGIRFNTDGTVEIGEETNGGGINWQAAGVWITPQALASAVYDVRFTNLVQNGGAGGFDIEAAAEGVWIDLGAQRVYTLNRTVVTVQNFDCDFEVRDGGGAPPATGTRAYNFNIENTT